MGPIAVDLALMRDVLLPGLTLTPGRVVAARVVMAENGRGSLSIAGYLIDAELPREVRGGDELRLEVRDVDARRVLLQIASAETAETPTPPPAATVTLPGGGALRILEDDEGGDGGAGRDAGHRLALSLRLDGLGTVDLRFSLDQSSVALDVALAPGDPLSSARDSAGALRDALAQVTQRPATVTISPRREPLDVYA